MVTKPEVRFTESQKKRYEKIMEAIGGESVLRDIVETDVVSGNHDRANAVLNEVRQAETAWAMEELGWSEEKAQAKAARLIAPMLRSRLENAYEYVTTKDIAGKLVQDTDAMQQELREKAPDADVASWLLPKWRRFWEKRVSTTERTPTPSRATAAVLPSCTTPTPWKPCGSHEPGGSPWERRVGTLGQYPDEHGHGGV